MTTAHRTITHTIHAQLSTFKKRARAEGFERWPHRKLSQSLRYMRHVVDVLWDTDHAKAKAMWERVEGPVREVYRVHDLQDVPRNFEALHVVNQGYKELLRQAGY